MRWNVLIFCCIAISFNALSSAQPYWKQYWVGTNASVEGVTATSSGDLFAAVYYAGLYKSHDDGAHWQRDALFPMLMMDVICTKENDVFLGIESWGNILFSSNLGESWIILGDTIDT